MYGEESQITLKSSEQLLDEVNNVLEYYNASYDSLESFINSDLKKLKTQLEKNQLAFIDAIEKHYDMYLDMLNEGEVHTVSQEDVKMGAEDEYATFVKTVHLNLPLEWLKVKLSSIH